MRAFLLLILFLCSNAFAADYYFDLTIDHTKVSASQSDFPVLITEANVPAAAWDYITNTTGANITASDDACLSWPESGDQYAKEVVSVNTSTEKCEIYVCAPSVSSTVDTVIRIWISDTSTVANSADTWNSDTAAVYHFESDGADSSNQTNLTKYGTPTNGAGYIGNAFSYSNSDADDYFYTASEGGLAAIETNSKITCFILVKMNATSQTNRFVYQTGNNDIPLIYGYAANKYELYVNGGAFRPTVATVSDTDWHVIAFTYNEQNFYSYLDGSAITSTTSTQNINISSYNSKVMWVVPSANASVDETRFFSSILSSNDIVTIYNNLSAPATFGTEGALQTVSSAVRAIIINVN